jgi:hypothetical protein
LAAAAALPAFASCNQTVGECWPVGQGDGSEGTGAGVMGGTGVGASGDVPPEQPQSVTYPEADCNIVSQGSCNDKCEASYEAAAAECGKIAIEAQRKTCQDAAYAAYQACRTACASDPVEQCKKLCDKENRDCVARCPKGDKGCMNDCNQKNGRCLKECEK